MERDLRSMSGRQGNQPCFEVLDEQAGDNAELAAERADLGLVGQEDGRAEVADHTRCRINDGHSQKAFLFTRLHMRICVR